MLAIQIADNASRVPGCSGEGVIKRTCFNLGGDEAVKRDEKTYQVTRLAEAKEITCVSLPLVSIRCDCLQ